MQQVVILHGWSDTSKSFQGLAKFLKKNGCDAVPLWLGDYISLDDDVAVKDVAKQMHAVILEMISSGKLSEQFDMIVHSTGGLVAREWLVSYYADGNARNCPLKKIIMLAPANFGSRLASVGQSMLGRLVKGWGNWFHTGMRMLQNLELSSPYQWELVERDLLSSKTGPSGSIYGNNGVWPFVIIGTSPYSDPLRSILNEEGADGTVRVAAANMNVLGATIDFTADESNPNVDVWGSRLENNWKIPFAVLPASDHSSITQPQNDEDLGKFILEALSCNNVSSYRKIYEKWYAVSENTARLGLVDPADPESASADGDKGCFHQFMQVNVHVVDDHGDDVPDFFLEFFGPSDLENSDEAMAYFHKEVLQNVHNNGLNSAYRCLYVDWTDLYKKFYLELQTENDSEKKLWMSISASPLGKNVSYFKNYKTGAAGKVLAHQFINNGDILFRFIKNSTHFIKIIIPRTPSEKVFRMTKA